MSKWKRLAMITISTSILLTQGGPFPYLASAVVLANQAQINGNVTFSWTTPDQVMIGTPFNPYDSLQAIDADGDDVAVLVQVAGEVDTSRVGTYSITYSIKNVDNETFTMTRQVEVVARNSTTDKMTEESEVLNEQETTEANYQDEESNDEVKDETTPSESNLSMLNDVTWTLYDRINQKELIKFNVNLETGYYESQISTFLTEYLMNVDDNTFSEEVLKLCIWSKEQEEKLSTTLTVRDLVDKTEGLKSLKELPYEIGDLISLIPISNETTILSVHGIIGGDISNEQADYENGVQNEDYLHNVRFQLTEDGLKTIYNEAPSIEGIQDTNVSDFETFNPKLGVTVNDDHDENLLSKLQITTEQLDERTQKINYQVTDSWGRTTKANRLVFKNDKAQTKIFGNELIFSYQGESFNPKDHIEAVDSNNNNIIDLVQVTGEVDINQLGTYILKYSVMDEQGQESTFEQIIKVIEKNTFNLFSTDVDGNKQLAFSLYVNPNQSCFVIENQSEHPLNENIPDGIYATIRLLDKDHQEKLSVVLLGKDNGFSENLEILKKMEYVEGDLLAISVTDPKNDFSIEGNLLGDIPITQEDYQDGVDNLDYLQNVRFELTNEGVKTIYNQAPDIEGLTLMTQLLTDRDQQLQGITIIDDHDGIIPSDHLIITEERNFDNQVIGLRYTVTDSFGRSMSKLRLLQEFEENHYQLYNSRVTTLKDTSIEIHGVPYNNEPTNTFRFKILFNTNDRVFEIQTLENDRLFDNKLTEKYFELVVYDSNGIKKSSLTINGNDKSSSEKLREFNGTQFEYGDQIHLYHYYSDSKLKIKGPVINVTNGSFEDGISADTLSFNRFEITESGLKFLENTPPTINWKTENLTVLRGNSIDLLADVEVIDDYDKVINNTKVIVSSFNSNVLGSHTVTYTVTDSWGATTTRERIVTVTSESPLANTSIDIYSANQEKAFSITFDDYNKQIFIRDGSSQILDKENPNDAYFRLRIYSKAGVTKNEIILNGSSTSDNKELQSLNGYRYTVGDQIELWAKNSNESKVIKIVGEIDKDEHLKDVNFSDGIPNNFLNDEINDIRFVLEVNTLKAIYNEAPTIVFKSDLTFTRSETFNPLEYVEAVIDDHDILNIESIRTTYENHTINMLGDHEVTYMITDKWGKKTTQKITITTLPKNKLEQTRIQFRPNSEIEPIFTLCFNDVEKQLEILIEENEGVSGIANTDALILRLFDKNGNIKAESIVKANIVLTESLFIEILSTPFEYGDQLFVSSTNHENLLLDGELISQTTKTSSTLFPDDDQMRNSRLTLSSEGLTSVYNQAPNFTKLDDLIIENGSDFDYLSGVEVADDKDSLDTLMNQITTNITSIDTNIPGNYEVIYTVTDSWGRTTSKVRNIYVKSVIEGSNIQVKNSTGVVSFEIGFDLQNNQLTSTIKNHDVLNSSNSDIEFYMATFDENSKYLSSLQLLGTDTNLEEKLKEFVQKTFREGYKLFIWSHTPSNILIQGDVIKGENLPEDINYSTGLSDDEYLTNVIFIANKSGLQAIYNPKPTISLKEDIFTNELYLYKGDNYREELLKFVQFNDLNDELTPSQVEIILTKTDNDSAHQSTKLEEGQENPTLSLGTYRVSYTVRDSWGRPSEILETDVQILPSIDRNTIVFGGYETDKGSIDDVFQLKFDTSNSSDKKLKVHITRTDLEDINNGASGQTNYYKITLQRQGHEDIEVTLSSTGEWQSLINQLNDVTFEYGDSIKIHASQVFRISLKGPIRNPFEIDQNGYEVINQGDDFLNTKFIITEEGLTAEYDNPVSLTNQESLIEYIAYAGTPFKMKINHQTKQIEFPETSGNFAWSVGPEGQQVIFTLIWHKVDGTETRYEHIGNDSNANQQLQNDAQNGFDEGDYFTFEVTNPQNVRLTGSYYFDGTKTETPIYLNQDLVMNSRLYLRSSDKQYMELVYNSAPIFTGVDEVNLYVNDKFDPFEEVSVKDDKDSNLTFTITKDGLALNEGDSQTFDALGTYTYTYTSTDSWGRQTIVERKVHVRPNSYKNRIRLYANQASQIDEQSSTKPVFEIIFDNITKKYTVINQLNQVINIDYYQQTAFSFTVYSSSGDEKVKIELNGNDLGTSPKLDILKSVTYEEGDYLRIWAFNSQHLQIIGPILGNTDPNIKEANTNLDGIYSDDYIKNTAFKTTSEGLEALYNEAPHFKIENEIELLYSDNIDLEDFIRDKIYDDKDDESKLTVNVTGNIDVNQIGTYTVSYAITDSWGRTSHKDVTFNVVSKIKNNSIEVWKDINGESQKQFTIKFNIENNRLSVEPHDILIKERVDTLEEIYFTLIVRNSEAQIKTQLDFTESELLSEEKLNQIKTISFTNGDYICLESSQPTQIKVMGSLVQSTVSNQQTEMITIDNKYINGFTDKDDMSNHRFKIGNYGFELIEFEFLNVNVTENLELIRGDDSNVYDGLQFNYQSPDNYNGITVTVEDLNILTLGEQTIKYTICDSWGSKIEIYRMVMIVEPNDLEKNKITIKSNTTNQPIYHIFFDTIEKKIIMKKGSGEYNGEQETLLIVTVYDELGITKGTLVLTKDNVVTDINDTIDFDEGDLIAISNYYDKSKISISGTIKDQKEDYTNGVSTNDHLDNVRFKIQESGLESIYNNAPILTIIDDLIAYKDENIDLYQGVTVSDEDPHDASEIYVDNIQIDTDLDITRIGTYQAIYTVADTWGRTTSEERQIHVKPLLENNKIEYYAPTNSSTKATQEPVFSIAFDTTNNQFVVTKYFTTSWLKSLFSKTIDSTDDTQIIFGIGLYDDTMQLKNSLVIKANDSIESISQKLDTFNHTSFNVNDYIGFFAQDHQNGIKITGNINKDTKITEDYAQGIQNIDFMNNVRFKITNEELHARYNEAPVIELSDTQPLEYYRGDTIYIGEGMLIRDDHDTYISNKLVEVTQDSKDKLMELGEQTINYIISDSWGRTTQGSRQVIVKNPLSRNEFIFGGYKFIDNDTAGNISEVFKLTLDTSQVNTINKENSLAARLKVQIIRDDLTVLNDRATHNTFYEITIKGVNGIEKKKITLATSYNGVDMGRDWQEKLNELNDIDIEFGDSIHIYAFQTSRISIKGEIRDALEDYSTGVNKGDTFIHTTFHVEQQGIRAEYNNPIELTEEESLIEYNVGNGKPLSIKINHTNGRMELVGTPQSFFYYSSSNPLTNVFTITIYNADGIVKEKLECDGNANAAGEGTQGADFKNRLDNFLQNTTLESGDYITFEAIDNLYSYIELSGKIIVPEDADELLKLENFSSGIRFKENMERGLFYYNKDNNPGITVIKKGAPTITGVDDIRIPQNSNFNAESGVIALDYDGTTDLTSQMTVTGNIDTTRLGVYELKYEVTNSIGVKTVIYRNITVYSEATLAMKDSNINSRPPLEQGSISGEQAIKDYLLTLVQAYDPEDENLSDKIIVEKHNVNPEISGDYEVTYSVTNSYGQKSELTVLIRVSRTISVSVPINVPFQIVTNLLDNSDPFVSGIIKLKNEKTSQVEVYIKSFEKVENSGDLMIVSPTIFLDWKTLSVEDSMRMMSLGLYHKFGLTDVGTNGNPPLTQESPLWLTSDLSSSYLGCLPRRKTTMTEPSEAALSFVSEHGSNFESGKVRGQFKISFEFR